MEQGPRGTGPTRKRSTCEKDRSRAKLEQEQSKRDHGREWKWKQRDNDSTTACIFAFQDSHDNWLTSWNSSDDHFAIFTLSPAPRTYTLHMVTTDIYLHISGYCSVRGMRIPLYVFHYMYVCVSAEWSGSRASSPLVTRSLCSDNIIWQWCWYLNRQVLYLSL